MELDAIVVGGGPAGMLGAAAAAQAGKKVVLLEQNSRLGRKLGITGKGRCNLTNFCDVPTAVAHFPTGGRFLFSALSRFSPADTMALLEGLGVPLKVERGNRVFPQSDKAGDIVRALEQYVRQSGAEVRTGCRAAGLQIEEGAVRGVSFAENGQSGVLAASYVLLAGGGLSYPATGSDGSCYALARQAGHSVVEAKPSLVPLVTEEDWPRRAQGLSLKNVALTVTDQKTKREIFSRQGELLFTHFGLSGPLVLAASAWMRPMEERRFSLSIDLKPALAPEVLDARLVRDFQARQNRDFCNCLDDLLPGKLIPIIVELSGIEPHRKAHSVTRAQRLALGSLLKALTLTVLRPRPIDEAIVTSGGVKLSEVNPKTMESKLVSGLYFAGELLDADGYTGGFNLQAAFATGRAAGKAIGAR